jgi:hypothetical protein
MKKTLLIKALLMQYIWVININAWFSFKYTESLTNPTRFEDLKNNKKFIDKTNLNTNNPNTFDFKFRAADFLYAQPFQSGNVYKITDLIDSHNILSNTNNWNRKNAASYQPSESSPKECGEGKCSNGVQCLDCYPTAKCNFDEASNVLECGRLNASFDYSAPLKWQLAKGKEYSLNRDQTGKLSLTRFLSEEECARK